MNQIRLITRFIAAFLLLAGIGFTGISSASAELVEGRDYTVLHFPQPVESGKKIEVLEFFWYGCPHCNDLHPHLKAWLKKMPRDVSFRYVPAVFRPNWVPGAKTFYAMDALGVKDKLHDRMYEAVHLDNLDMTKEDVLFGWVAKQGVDRKKFMEAYNSFSVGAKAAQSAQMSRDYALSGVPSLVVDGKYLTSGKMGGTAEDTLRILDELIVKVRKEKEKK